ncbi:hypothetical protein KC717_00370 [Candidatus Dojkabacteria bacterium]|uniref:Uncharacterized protein n=1 Tax=Candidatus Dojkabacteria bacterium TaxID=2099670 RepID=A0A955L7L0_9BACT|nr:hypothetical protein [Candidatus Dojkabacteria bacterium]
MIPPEITSETNSLRRFAYTIYTGFYLGYKNFICQANDQSGRRFVVSRAKQMQDSGFMALMDRTSGSLDWISPLEVGEGEQLVEKLRPIIELQISSDQVRKYNAGHTALMANFWGYHSIIRDKNIAQAVQIAGFVHSDDVRKGNGYTNYSAHIERVFITSNTEAKRLGIDQVLVGTLSMLHDVPEDIYEVLQGAGVECADKLNTREAMFTYLSIVYKDYPKVVDQLRLLTMDYDPDKKTIANSILTGTDKTEDGAKIEAKMITDLLKASVWQSKIAHMDEETALVKMSDMLANSDGFKLNPAKMLQRLIMCQAIKDNPNIGHRFNYLISEFCQKNQDNILRLEDGIDILLPIISQVQDSKDAGIIYGVELPQCGIDFSEYNSREKLEHLVARSISDALYGGV